MRRSFVAGLTIGGWSPEGSLARELRTCQGQRLTEVTRANGRQRREERLSLAEIADRAAAEAERQAIVWALQATLGNKREAARLLRVDDNTLHIKMKRYGIDAGELQAS